MELMLDNNEKLTFAWRQSGGLTIQKWHASQAKDTPWILAGTSIIEGEELLNFLQSLIHPVLRRALDLATKWPGQKL